MINILSHFSKSEPEGDIHARLKWLMFARVIFTAVLLISTVIAQYNNTLSDETQSAIVLYSFILAIFFLSLLYSFLAKRIKRLTLFAYFQIGIDSFIVTLIIYITSGFFSVFSFLYLIVVIYASMILALKGGIFVAILSNLQYGCLLLMQFFSMLPSIGMSEGLTPSNLSLAQILLKILMTTIACLAVAVLSGLLIEQNRTTQKELRSMEIHVKRVEKLAYMGEMAAGLAHEIKNPLASLVGSIQMLREELPFNNDHQRLMEIVSREADRLSTLVNEFLFFSRPPAGKPQKINLKEAMEEVCELFLKDTQLTEQVVLDRDLTPEMYVVMDPTHLRQVLWNLMINAAEALNERGHIQVTCKPAKNNEIQLKVSDNGCGIPAHEIHSIFNPFFTTKSEGTGLGLSIIHRILEAYGSRLDVDTKVGVGTTFTFSLKRAKSPS